MTFAEQIIKDAVEDGYNFIVLEPRESFAPAIMEFHREEKRLVYNIDTLLLCLSKANGWDSLVSLEWFDYNIFSLTYMEGGPLFYDEFEGKILTLED